MSKSPASWFEDVEELISAAIQGVPCDTDEFAPDVPLDYAVTPRKMARSIIEALDSAGVFAQTTAQSDVLYERWRQQSVEHHSLEQDDKYLLGELPAAAACYLVSGQTWAEVGSVGRIMHARWPWSGSWWKPRDKRRNLARAAALILAEMERMDRATVREAR